MSKKAADLAAKKQAKQKKVAIGALVIFLAVMGYSLPKTLKMLKGPQPIPTPAVQTTPSADPATATTPADSDGAGVAAPVGAAVLVDTDGRPEAGEGQLVSFERFASKDPFAQQVDGLPADAPAAESTTEDAPVAEDDGVEAADALDPASPPASAPTPIPTPAPAPTQEPAAQPAPAPAPKPTSAVIAVNGVNETVKARGSFPEADPVFELVSLTATEIKIGIAGGSLAGGAPTVTLKKGKKVTLMNTADGTRYELVLVSLA